MQRPPDDGGVGIFSQKNGLFEPPIFLWGNFLGGVSPLKNNIGKTSVGENLVKIRPAVAEQSRQKIKTQNGY